jgi:hypothetical protein
MPRRGLEHSAGRALLQVEHGIQAVLGIALAFTAVLALAAALIGLVWALFQGPAVWGSGDTLFIIIDRLLFVLMLAEILYTVRVSLGSGVLMTEPFLVVGLIACIRRVLVITLEHTQVSTGGDRAFYHSVIELGAMAVLIAVMVGSIILLRRSRQGRGAMAADFSDPS